MISSAEEFGSLLQARTYIDAVHGRINSLAGRELMDALDGIDRARQEFPELALVAIGGYGRAELNPHSDIDFMFLQNRQVVAGSKPLPHLSKLIDGILYPLWDLGLKVGTVYEAKHRVSQLLRKEG